MRRGLAVVVALIACGKAAPAPVVPPPDVRVASVVDAAVPEMLPPFAAAEVPAAIDDAWRKELAGDVDGARAVLERIKHERAPLRSRVAGRSHFVDDRRAFVLQSFHQIFLVDVATKSIVAEAPMEGPADVLAIPGSSLFVVRSRQPASLRLYDRALQPTDLPFDDVAIAPDGKTLAGFRAPKGEGNDVIALYDPKTRTTRWQVEVPRDADDPAGAVSRVGGVAFTDGGHVVTGSWIYADGAFIAFEADTGKRIVRLDVGNASPPAFSTDGRQFAHCARDESVKLVDRATGSVIASTKACPQPFALDFDASGTRLAVGGQNKICVLDVPSLKLLGNIVTMRPPPVPNGGGAGIFPSFIDATTLFAKRQDFRAVLYRLPASKELWSVEWSFFERTPTREFTLIDIKGMQRVTLAPTGEVQKTAIDVIERDAFIDRQRNWEYPDTNHYDVDTAVCEAGQYYLPAQACPKPSF